MKHSLPTSLPSESSDVLRPRRRHIAFVSLAVGMVFGASIAVSHARAAEAPGRLVARFEGPAELDVQYSEDGARLVTCGKGGTRVWDMRTLKAVTPVLTHVRHGKTQSTSRCALSRDGKRVLTASKDEVRVWDADGGQLRHTLGEMGDVNSVALSDDGKRAVVTSTGRSITVWDVVSGKPINTLLHRGEGHYAIFSPGDGDRVLGLISGDLGFQHTGLASVLWDARSGWPIVVKPGGDPGGRDLPPAWRRAAFMPDGRIARNHETHVGFWDPSNPIKISSTEDADGSISSIAVSPNGRVLATCEGHGVCVLYNVASGKRIVRYDRQRPTSEGVSHAVFSPDGQRILAGGFYAGTALYDADASSRSPLFGPLPAKPSDRGYELSAIAYAPDNRHIAIGRASGETRIWEIDAGPVLP